MDEEATQQATQPVFDPRRLGLNNSGLTDADMRDVICILHPNSSAAIKAVNHVARTAPQHILQNQDLDSSAYDDDFLADDDDLSGKPTLDIALRLSSPLKDITMGFIFGRNPDTCDFGPGDGGINKRVSNRHFRIWVTRDEVLMLQDMSTNGTYVDQVLLRRSPVRKPQQELESKRAERNDPNEAQRLEGAPASSKESMVEPDEPGDRRMLVQSSIILLLMDQDHQAQLRFIVRLPPRTGYEEEYTRNLHSYLDRVEQEQRLRAIALGGNVRGVGPGLPLGAATLAGTTTPPAVVATPPYRSTRGTRTQFAKGWDGGKKYNIIGTAGKGAFATVYKVATKRDGEVYAAKELNKRIFVKNGIFDQKVHNEMHIMKRLNHRHIVRYVEDIQANDNLYIIMEYVPGGDLGTIINDNGPLREPTVIELARQIFSALEYLHESQITHRDIKPDNILIVRDHPIEVKLSDFGLSKVIEDNETFLKTFCGTLLYCAPEVFSRYSEFTTARPKRRRREKSLPHRYGPACDMWSFAAVLFMALSGHPPFSARNGDKDVMLNKIMTTTLNVRPLIQYNVSTEGISLLKRLLNPFPDERPMERECLNDPWLNEGAEPKEMDLDEGETQAAQHPVTGLPGNGAIASDSDSETDVDVNGRAGLFPGPSKRLKLDEILQGQHPDFRAISAASPDDGSTYGSPVTGTGFTEFFEPAEESRRPNRLFGEIGESTLGSSILGSSGIMPHVGHLTLGASPHEDERVVAAPQPPSHQIQAPTASAAAIRPRLIPNQDQRPLQSARRPELDATSQAGAQPPVAHQRLTSLPGQVSVATPSHPPAETTAVNPMKTVMASTGKQATGRCTQCKLTLEAVTAKADDGTANKSMRRRFRPIDIPVPDGYYYDPYDKSTHNAEYAARMRALEQSGGVILHSSHADKSDALHAQAATNSTSSNDVSGAGPLDAAIKQPVASVHGNGKGRANGAMESSDVIVRELVVATTDQVHVSEFARPLPIYGKLITTPGSIFSLTINLNQRETSWGRSNVNTLQYPNPQEVRVPKFAFEILFWRPGFEDSLKNAGDWTSIPNLYANIKTQTTRHISVNGVRLVHKDRQGYPFGRLYTGDVVTVYDDRHTGHVLKFTCEFFHGASAGRRPAGQKPFEIHHIPLSAAASWPGSQALAA